jgi:hypothetical protein
MRYVLVPEKMYMCKAPGLTGLNLDGSVPRSHVSPPVDEAFASYF